MNPIRKITALLVSMLALAGGILLLSSCELDVNVSFSDEPADGATLRLTVAFCEPPLPDSVEEDCFYAHDASGSLYRVIWNDTCEIGEGSEVYVDFDAVRQLSYTDGYPNGWTPRYEVSAKSVRLRLPFELPDFPEQERREFGWGGCEHIYDDEVTLNQVRKYVKELEKEGFTVVRSEEVQTDRYVGDAFLLYRENVTILIGKSDYRCTLRYHITRSPEGNAYTPGVFSPLTSEELLTRLDSEKALYAFEVTPRALHNATGARLYEVVVEDVEAAGGYYECQAWTTNLILVGKEGMLPLHGLFPEKLYFRDADGNGFTEIYYISAGYTYGVRTELIHVLEVVNGTPTVKAVELVYMRGDLSFAEAEDGNLLLRETPLDPENAIAPAEYPFIVEDGHVYLIIDGEKVSFAETAEGVE